MGPSVGPPWAHSSLGPQRAHDGPKFGSVKHVVKHDVKPDVKHDVKHELKHVLKNDVNNLSLINN